MSRKSAHASMLLLMLLIASAVAVLATAVEVSEEAQVTDHPNRELHPCMGVDSDGNLHVVYYNLSEGAGRSLHYRKVTPSGVTLRGPVRVTADEAEEVHGVDLTVDRLDRVHIVHSVLYAGEVHSDVRYLRLDKDGTVALRFRPFEVKTLRFK